MLGFIFARSYRDIDVVRLAHLPALAQRDVLLDAGGLFPTLRLIDAHSALFVQISAREKGSRRIAFVSARIQLDFDEKVGGILCRLKMGNFV